MLKIIEILKQKFKKIFKARHIALDSSKSDLENESVNKNIEENNNIVKKDFFEIYKNVKNGKIKLEDLMINDLIKVQLMMQQEKEMLDNKIVQEEKRIEEYNKRRSRTQKKSN